MANFTWAFDSPTGTYKNNALSSDIRQAAIVETKFMQFVKPEPGYGKKSGESITINRISNLAIPTSGKLTENIMIPEDALTITTVSITVSEWGRSVPYTSLSDDLSKLNLENVVQRTLKDQMKVVMDNACAAAFKTAKVMYIPTGVATGVFDTDGTPSTSATSNITLFHIETVRDYLFSTLNAPAYEGDEYIGLISTKGKRGLVSDPGWEDWHKYTDPQSKYNSEIGKMEGIRFIEVNNTTALSGSKGTGSVLGEAVIFGADAVAMAVVQDPELRLQIPKDYGRQKGIAWYGVLEFGLIWDTANAGEARVVRITSS